MEFENHGIERRDFIKPAFAGACGVAMSGVFGCFAGDGGTTGGPSATEASSSARANKAS